jgi:hypothetical protein
MRAAVKQEQLADHHRQQRVILPAEPIAPLCQHRTDSHDLTVHAITPEEPPRQGQPLEAAQPMELGERTEQVGMGREVGADLVAGPGGRVAAELGQIPAEQMHPLLCGPAPVRSAHLGAPHQQHGDHVQHRASPVRSGR